MSQPTKCPACGREIFFVTSPAGKNLPVEAIANVYLLRSQLSGGWVSAPAAHDEPISAVALDRGPGHWVSHYATCTKPEAFRKRDRSQDPTP